MEYFTDLCARFPKIAWERVFSFAKHTTIGCGGVAALAASPADEESAAKLLGTLCEERIPHCFLGAGANVLPADGLFEGVVVRFDRLKMLCADGETLFAGAGVTGGALLRFAERERIGGFEPLTGIPMTVGGGIVMNAGISEGHFSDVTAEVIGIEKGKIRKFSLKDCAFSEKTSIFQSGIAVTGAYLKGKSATPSAIAARREFFRARRAHLPKGRSMGCVFVNPAGDTAGRLIEHCGLKGIRVGGAVVSHEHANFILNEGGSSADVSALIALVKEEVLRQTGVLLREEIRRLP